MSSELLKYVSRCAALFVVVSCLFPGGSVVLGFDQQAFPKEPAREFVRRVVQHELAAQAADHSHWMYVVHHEEPGKTERREVIETAEGDLELVLSRNGRPLSAKERQQEIRYLRRLAAHPAELHNARADKREDGDKADQLLRLLPDAFLFDYERVEGNRIVLRFRPDPSFRPPTREATVFHHMTGTITLDTKEERIAAIQGRLIDEVKFGGGVLGHLDKGGQFHVEQSEIAPGHWEITRLDVAIRGKALLFKTINLQQKEQRTAFRRVPDQMTLAQAADLLIQEGAG